MAYEARPSGQPRLLPCAPQRCPRRPRGPLRPLMLTLLQGGRQAGVVTTRGPRPDLRYGARDHGGKAASRALALLACVRAVGAGIEGAVLAGLHTREHLPRGRASACARVCAPP
jgi:hypothetical protein